MEKMNVPSSYTITKRLFYLTTIGIALLVLSSITDLFDIRGVESNVVYSLQLISKDNNMIYASPEAPPYNITMYSPLYYLVSDAMLTISGIDSTDFYPYRIITRIFSTIALILSLLVVRSILSGRLQVDKDVANIACLFFFVATFPWYNITRPDSLMLLFLVLAIDSVIAKRAILLGVYIFLGLATKLTMIVCVLPIGLYVLYTKNWKLILIAGASFLVSLAILYGVLIAGNYDLTFLKKNVLDSIKNGYDIPHSLEKVYSFFFSRFAVFVIAVALLCVEVFRRWHDSRKDTILIFLLLISFVTLSITCLMSLKAGAAENYFCEPVLFLILLSLYLLERHYKEYRQLYVTAFMVFGIVSSASGAIRYKYLSNKYPHPSFFFSQNRSGKASELNDMKQYLSERLGPDYFYTDFRELAMSFPFQCVMFPGDIHENTYKRNVYDYTMFQKWVVESRKLKYLAVYPYTQSVYGVNISDLYVLKAKFPNYYVYELVPLKE